MFKNLFKNPNKNKKVLYAFANGTSIDLAEVKDEVFSQKMMGEGIAISPVDNKVYSPCDGKIIIVMQESKHAVGIETEDGVEILIHVGIDTVSLKGEGFNIHCEEGQRVKKGDLLISFDKSLLKDKGLDDTIMLILANQNNHEILNFHVDKNMVAKDSVLLEYK
ncbi:PTS sugar transporter subunit IIA [Clostridium folliculivorans]|uniref:PTS glucose transporter subunit IIABC n=1 Tax=Clostridium folliculivorans TaxID=2886038 RepID=A0A9W6DAT4_9CLOT|nr:PTS glucose transporter subunit IIA [Clostridium folliculivorans]GKU25157.1 PTS glucose transporter subunit IIABC [Clostridium folliculivorans]GKU31255.1 PTS glucose transporter subunit IIABC [Clostridium folliculivorans]